MNFVVCYVGRGSWCVFVVIDVMGGNLFGFMWVDKFVVGVVKKDVGI